ncbi:MULTISPECIES: fused response regulator/phosphatase [Streptomyces]|uniref:Fused response regulator/phosphatase n=1 Tax=Streptomyces lichenis TaxID=2306967 RepID=A0ABT0I8I5_9ACTN|nr:fused response regulator/phosphatase [Streptomyces lichenis]MCK8677636.1 fused response regulator/phosphatase [Streptomyces lichenis]
MTTAAEPQYRIVLVEDDDGDALLVDELLIDTGLRYELTRCTTLAEARAELTVHPADCVLLDLHLPDAMGIGAVDAIQEAAPHAAIIVLTGLAESQAGIDAVAAGAQDYLVKGRVEPDLLHRAVRYAAQRKQAERVSAAIQAGQLRAEENARLERGLLPQPMLGASRISAASRYFPGRERALLGGDFLDVVHTPDGLLHAIVGDVSGHGPDAAALGVCLRIAWRALTLGGHRGRELLGLLERMLVAERTHADLFATVTLVCLDQAGRRATVYLAGHHAPLLTGGGSAREVRASHGIALGIAPGLANWHPSEVELPANGALMIYTDGLIEGHQGDEDERLGVEGLIQLVDRIPAADADSHLDELITEVRKLNADRHTDDLAILRLEWSGLGAEPHPAGRVGHR